MRKFNVSGQRNLYLLASVFSLGFLLAGCTSVEYTGKSSPVATTLPADTTTDGMAETAKVEEVTSPTNTTSNVVAANGAVNVIPTDKNATAITETALAPTSKASNSASEAITAAAQVTTAAQQEASSDVATTTQKASTATTTGFSEAKLVKAAFPPRPGAPGTPSAAEVPLTLEMMQVQSVVPMQKPRIPELAYAAAPQNAALAAIAENESVMSNPTGPTLRGKSQLNTLISKYAKLYEVPEELVHRVVHRESRYDPAAYNKGNYGLMQIRVGTAKGLGFKGTTNDLFDAETNLKYAVKYLRGAYLVAGNNHDQAVRLYARGYYYDAKRKGMLHVLN